MSNPPLSSLAPDVRPVTSTTVNSPSVSTGRVEWTSGTPPGSHGEVNWSKVSDSSPSAKSQYMMDGKHHHHMMADAGELGACARVPTDGKHHHHHYHEENGGTGWGWIIAVFIIVVVIVWILLYAFHPEFVQQRDRHGHPTGTIDHGTALIWAIIIGIVFVVIIGLIRGAASY